jgi:hypothetical protein
MADHSSSAGHGDAHGHGEVAVEESSLSNTGILTFCVLTALTFFGSAAALPGLFYRYTDYVRREMTVAGAGPELAKLRAEEEKRLGSYGFVDKDKQIVHIPIDVAMQKVIEEAKR